MLAEILEILLAAGASMAAGGVLSSEIIQRAVRKLLGIKEPPDKTYGERLSELTASLTKASGEADTVLQELARVARDREASVHQLETELGTLESREKEMQAKIAALEKTPLPVAEHFAQLLEKRDRTSARRDYALFGAGVFVTTIIGIVLQLVIRR
ncbi:MAG TPA: hypothetical protein VNY24_09630 [Candidatus Acidoferrales bacterium]|jgi:hypothetical protein|nr:hypothetical protein [Candidatus Acidoferrales bacterium]